MPEKLDTTISLRVTDADHDALFALDRLKRALVYEQLRFFLVGLLAKQAAKNKGRS